MKKLLALLIACFMLLAFVGCNSEKDTDSKNEASSTNDASSNNSSGLTSEELDEWWSDVEIEIEDGNNTSSGTSTESGEEDPDTPNTDTPNTDKPNTDKPNTDKPNTDTPDEGDENEDVQQPSDGNEGGEEEEKPSNKDEFNDYKPTEKDEGFGPWI